MCVFVMCILYNVLNWISLDTRYWTRYLNVFLEYTKALYSTLLIRPKKLLGVTAIRPGSDNGVCARPT